MNVRIAQRSDEGQGARDQRIERVQSKDCRAALTAGLDVVDRLGGHVLGFSDAKMTRAGDFYQESIKDTVHMLEYYGDVIAMRHFQQGAPQEAAKWASVPIINCGDGWGEHPTQVLTDLYTVNRELGGLDGQRWLLVGDMRMRTMHSILYAFSQFDIEAYVCAPPEMSLLPEFKEELATKDTTFTEVESVEKVIGDVDVIYMEPVVQADYTQSRVERGTDVGLTPREYQVTRKLLKQGTGWPVCANRSCLPGASSSGP